MIVRHYDVNTVEQAVARCAMALQAIKENGSIDVQSKVKIEDILRTTSEILEMHSSGRRDSSEMLKLLLKHQQDRDIIKNIMKLLVSFGKKFNEGIFKCENELVNLEKQVSILSSAYSEVYNSYIEIRSQNLELETEFKEKLRKYRREWQRGMEQFKKDFLQSSDPEIKFKVINYDKYLKDIENDDETFVSSEIYGESEESHKYITLQEEDTQSKIYNPKSLLAKHEDSSKYVESTYKSSLPSKLPVKQPSTVAYKPVDKTKLKVSKDNVVSTQHVIPSQKTDVASNTVLISQSDASVSCKVDSLNQTTDTSELTEEKEVENIDLKFKLDELQIEALCLLNQITGYETDDINDMIIHTRNNFLPKLENMNIINLVNHIKSLTSSKNLEEAIQKLHELDIDNDITSLFDTKKNKQEIYKSVLLSKEVLNENNIPIIFNKVYSSKEDAKKDIKKYMKSSMSFLVLVSFLSLVLGLVIGASAAVVLKKQNDLKSKKNQKIETKNSKTK